MKIAFILSTSYPTKKAYGITVRETALAATELGYSVVIISDVGNYSDVNFSLSKLESIYLKKNIWLQALLKNARSGSSFVSKGSWRIFQYLLIVSNRNLIQAQKAEILWCRDERTALLLQRLFPTKKIVIELHLPPKNNKIIKLVRNSKKGSLVIAPINKYIYNLIDKDIPRNLLVIAFTGVNESIISSEIESAQFIIRFKERVEFKHVKLGYFGKFYPGGYSKGFEDLLNFAVLNKSHDLKFNISIIGGADEDVEKALSIAKKLDLTESDIRILGHCEQKILFDFMRESDFIILPKPENEIYSGRPLKSLEACAVGRIIVAARCMVNEELFNGDFDPYWYEAGNSKSLLEALNFAMSDKGILTRVNKGINFANQYTWRNRVEKINLLLK